jgi:UDP-N-acetylmuramate dehydrogenase
MQVLTNELMSKHTNFRVGGPAKTYVISNTPDEVMQAIEDAKAKNEKFYVMGGGSNLLVSDEGFDGVIIQIANRGVKIEGETIKADAGAITALVARQSVDAGLTGFEWAIGVPGTIGGAIYGDAGCYGGEMRDVIESMDALRLRDGMRVTLTNTECGFGYRTSMFKSEPHLIFGCTIKLKPSQDVEASKKRMQEIVMMRKEKQPLESSSAGCAFKNFEFTDEKALEILKRHVEVPQSMIDKGQIPAGWLIEQAGMKGKSVGDVEVSDKHANFFINKGKARAQDIIALISLVKMKVRDDLGIELQEEVQLVGF